MNFLHAIFEPFIWRDSLELFWPIVVEGMLVSVALGLIGCFLVVRGMSLLGDALSHSVLPGIVVGFLISARFGSASLHSPWILIGATATGLLAALLVEAVQKHSRVKEDASLGIVFTTLFALGVVMINLFAGQADLDPGCVLYGNIEHFVLDRDGTKTMAVILGIIVAGLLLFYRQLLVSTFDPSLAISLGIPAALVTYCMLGVLSLTIVASFEAVGAILAVALLITPGATARLWTDRMPSMLAIAALHGVIATLIGYWLSHEAILNTSAGGAITVAGFGMFILSWLLAPRHGLIVQILVRARLRTTIAIENAVKAIDELTAARSVPVIGESDLRNELRLPAPQVVKIVKRGISRGWIQRIGDQLALTEHGVERAERLVRAHNLWEAYLQEKLGVAPDHVHDAAEWIEHHLDEEEVGRIGQAVSAREAASG